MLKKGLLGLLIVLIVAQFFQPPLNIGNAEGAKDISHAVNVPDSVMGILKTACYDCHSDNTNYPWYSKITPVNWWLNSHVNDGKRELNFTIFASYSQKKMNKKLEETAELVKEGMMPLNTYTWMHQSDKLTMAQKAAITNWVATAQEQLVKK